MTKTNNSADVMSPNFMSSETELLQSLDKKLDQFFLQMKDAGIHWNAEMSAYHFSTGGKRLRALMPSWIFQALGKEPQKAFPLGCALELIHNATLVHDDLQDGDTYRRGKETVWKKYSDVQAINCGDALYQFALEALTELDVAPATWKKIVARLSRGTLQVIEGQAQEFLMKDEEHPVWARYHQVVEGKTAALLSTATATALLALEVEPSILKAAEKASLESGILFQIQDDLLDIYGDKQRERKATDIAEGKISALVAVFNEAASLEDKKRVSVILRTPRAETTDAQIQQVIDLFEKYKVRETLIGKILNIRDAVAKDQDLQKAPELQKLFHQLNERFLLPIRHLL
jgi:geranylgeranyl diphosphate synthase, type I